MPKPSSNATPEAAPSVAPGRLVLVVGPSGAGKDTLLDGAKAALADDPRFVFARRHVTRPADAGGEDHVAVDDATFERIEACGGHLLSWRAHGLRYGVPAEVEEARLAGAHVVANVSRAILTEARVRAPGCAIVAIVAPPAVLRARLAARGRETATEIEGRIERAVALDASGPDVVEVVNDGTIAAGVAKLVDALRAAARG